MKNKILFIISVIGSVAYLVTYPILSSTIVNSIFTITGIIILYLSWNLRTDLKRNRSLKIGLWIIIVSIILIPRFFFRPDMELSHKVIWTLIILGLTFLEVSREFGWYSSKN